MSRVYIARLRVVLAEFDAAREALAYVGLNWQKQGIQQQMRHLFPRDFAQAGR